MIYWRGQPLQTLPRSAIEQAAADAINEAVGLREINRRRESFDSVVLGFLLGAAFSAAAVLVGISMHS